MQREIKITPQEARELIFEDYVQGEYDGLVEKKIVDHRRWSVIYEAIVNYKGFFYKVRYSVGATESQDEQPFEHDNMVKMIRVEQKQRLVDVWEEVNV